MKFGDIELVGKIDLLRLEARDDNLPHEENNYGVIFYNSEEKAFKAITENGIFSFSTATSSSDPVVNLLGPNWINENLSFNPVPFNTFDNVSGLISTDTLFDVLSQLDQAITNQTTITNEDLQSLFSSLVGYDIIVFDGNNFVNANINTLVGSSTFSIQNIEEFTVTNLSSGESLVVNDDGQIVNRKLYFEYENLTSNNTHTVTHQLNFRYPEVLIVDRSTNRKITNATVIYTNVNQLTVQLPTPAPVTIFISRLP